ncbi:MAG: hypothetical protein RLZZ385_1928 [Pseudomonadota bacterium]|jgi:hypothetical protein
MNRREFLLLCGDDDKTVELSCEHLYMQFTDAHANERRGDSEQGSLNGAAWWAGEPPLEGQSPKLDALFQSLEKRLEDVDVLRVSNRSWLKDESFKARVYSLLTEFQSRGGTVEFPGNELAN